MGSAESLDIEEFDALLEYLRREQHLAAAEQPRLVNLRGGVSNRTVLVERAPGRSFVLKQALEKLRVQADWFSDPRRVHREALGLRWLERLAPPGTIPPLVFEDPRHHLLALEAVPPPHENWKTMLLAGRLAGEHVQQFAELLGAIHRRSSERATELPREFWDRGFFQSLRLEPYYLHTAQQQPATAAFYQQLIADTLARRESLVHGDYSPKNVLVHADRLRLLDHEVIHFGDPAFDLGFALTHLLSKAHHVASHRAAFGCAAHAFWQQYREARGKAATETGFEQRAARHTLGCLLARIDGRSPLEYLKPEERDRQRRVVLNLMGKSVTTVPQSIDSFVNALQ